MTFQQFPRVASIAVLALALSPRLDAGFTGTDVVITATARTAGSGSSQFYSTLYVTNVSTTAPVDVTYRYLKLGQSNPSPQTVTATLAAGETKRYDNVLKTLFGFESGAAGAIRITATGRVLASSRTFDQPPGSSLADVKGLFFGAIPTGFAIALGESALLQGVSQGGSEDYRFNFGLVEVSGQPLKARVTLRSESGATLLTKDYDLGAYEALQRNASDLGSVSTTNGRIDVSIVEGAGRALVYGTQIANGSQDSSGFEMSFRDDLLLENVNLTTETVAGGMTASAVAAIGTSYDQTSRLPTQRAPLSTLSTLADPPSYDPVSGTWTVTIALANGLSGQVQIRFLDANGQPQKFYGPLTTRSMTSRGTLNGPPGSLTFDLALGGLGSASTPFTVSGSGSGTYQGVAATFTVTNLVVPKSTSSYPSSGTMTVVSQGSTVTVAFNGTNIASGSYTYRGVSVPFTINLDTGEVSH